MVKFENRKQSPSGGDKPVLQRIGAFVGEDQLERYEDLERAQDKRERMIGLALLIACAAATLAATVAFVLRFA